jgi:uncharacterized protein with NRDE domain
MLADTTRASDCRLPKTGVPLERERVLSSVCIESPDYGTRVSTLVKLHDHHHPVLIERPAMMGGGHAEPVTARERFKRCSRRHIKD